MTLLSRVHALALQGAMLTAVGCASGFVETAPPQDPAEVRAPNAVVFVNVRVVTMTDARVVEGSSVVVRGGTIEWIGPRDALGSPPDAVVIDGAGRYLAPALIDAHVHLRAADLPAYLLAGVGTVRNMWGHSGIPAIIRAVEEGTTLGPRVFSTGPGLDGTPPQWPETRVVTDAANADATVQSIASEGWTVMKVYQQLTLPVYDALLAAIRSRGLSAVGHVPTAVPVLHALEAGQRSIEHLTGYDRAVSRQSRTGTAGWVDVDASRFAPLADATTRAGTWNCPTLAIFVELASQHPPAERSPIIVNRRRFLLELSRHGAPLIAGTDAGIGVVKPGVSMHDELAEWVAAGLTPYQALRAATADAGRFLESPGLGTVTIGAPAYLMLLDDNPLANIANVRRLAGMVLRGEWFSAATLRAMASPGKSDTGVAHVAAGARRGESSLP